MACPTFRRFFAAVVGVILITACGSESKPREMRQWTEDMTFIIETTPLPPVAEEVTTFKIIAQDKKTGQPIESGEGRIFASHIDRANAYDGLAKGEEVGTYYARIRFPLKGDWVLGLQFRRDSTKPLQRTNDWTQTVLKAPPLGTPSKSE